MKNTTGFSLIELMIVVLIIGILSSVAIPNYQRYMEKARFSEVITSAEPFKLSVALGLQMGDPIESLNSGEHGVPTYTTNSKNVDTIRVRQGVITATASEAASGNTYILTPDDTGASWQISGSCVDTGMCRI
jgi:prepilin-type N-terminal cleavage/methylation domain-containing protein